MSKERSIAKRLSGGEALDSLCHQIRNDLVPSFRESPADLDALMRGIWGRLCRHEDFHSHRGYHGYSAKVEISWGELGASVRLRFTPAMSYGRPPLNDSFSVPVENARQFPPIAIEIPVRPPNAVRMEAEMPLPVEVEEAGQIVEKMVPAAKYKGKIKKGVSRPQTENMEVPTLKAKMPMPDGATEQYGIQGR